MDESPDKPTHPRTRHHRFPLSPYSTLVCGLSGFGSPPALVAVPSRCGLTMLSSGGMGASNILYTTS